jgi:hypothetical protein
MGREGVCPKDLPLSGKILRYARDDDKKGKIPPNFASFAFQKYFLSLP